jgi:hypothetical protein
MFVDTTNVLAALDSLAVYYAGLHRSFARDSVVLRLVRWNWVQLYEWSSYVLSVAGLEGWCTADIDEVTNRLEFGARTDGDRDALLGRLRQLGVPCWLAAVHVGGCAVFASARPPSGESGVVGP